MKSVSSDISLRAAAPVSALEINTVSGDVSAVAPRVGQLRAVTVSGDVELEAELADGRGHRVETVSGDVSLGVVGGLTLEVRGLSTDVDVRLPHRRRGRATGAATSSARAGPTSCSARCRVTSRCAHARRRGVPTPPAPPAPPTPPTVRRLAAVSDDEQLAVLQALERGEIDVEEATRRLAGAEVPSDG